MQRLCRGRSAGYRWLHARGKGEVDLARISQHATPFGGPSRRWFGRGVYCWRCCCRVHASRTLPNGVQSRGPVGYPRTKIRSRLFLWRMSTIGLVGCSSRLPRRRTEQETTIGHELHPALHSWQTQRIATPLIFRRKRNEETRIRSENS